MAFKQALLLLGLICLALCQVTPEDLEKMKLKLEEIEKELTQLVPQIDGDTKQIETDKLEEVRQKGGEGAVKCAEKAADNLSVIVHQIGYFNLIGLASYLQQCRENLDSGKLSQDELEQMKNGLLEENGVYHMMTDVQIEQTKKFDIKKIFEFTQAADECCKIQRTRLF